MVAEKDNDFLYVPEDEISEALSIGAKMIPGDARLVKPRPVPPKVDAKAFERWQTVLARHRWCMRYIARVADGLFPLDDVDKLFQTIGKGESAHERVYLWVVAKDIPAVRRLNGIEWDKRRRMYYATPSADLNGLFEWLTPMAREVWEAERVTERQMTLLVQEQAETEARRRKSAGDVTDIGSGKIKIKQQTTRTIAT